MATRAEVRKTDNSKLGRSTLTSRAGLSVSAKTETVKAETVKAEPVKVVAKKPVKKTTTEE